MTVSELDTIFAALADPTRRAILASLSDGPKSMGEIAKPFDMTGPAVTKHLKVLEQAGLIKTDKVAQMRPRRLDAKKLREVHEYIGSFRRFWEESFDRLDALLEEVQYKENKHDDELN